MPVRTKRGRRRSSRASEASTSPWPVAAAAARRMASGWPAISAMNMSGNFPNECMGHRLQCAGVEGNPKIAVIGGGSTYTPELIEGLALRAERLGLSELVLHDVDQSRLDVVGGLAGRILRRQGYGGRLACTTDRRRAIAGASYVLVQLPVGGLQARLLDETVPA